MRIAVKKMMESHPRLRHPSHRKRIQRMAPLLVSRSTGSAPKTPSSWLSPPVSEGLRKLIQIPAITTQERKWGR